MVRAADVVANRLGRPLTKENRARVDTFLAQRVGIINAEFQMLRRDPVRKCGRLIKVFNSDDCAVIAPAWTGNCAPLKR
jgi:hypothetical protein